MPDNADRRSESEPFRSKTDFIESKLAALVKSYAGKHKESRFKAKGLKASTLALTTATTMMLGVPEGALPQSWLPHVKTAAFLLSALSSALLSWEAYVNHAWKWVRYRTTLGQLRDIKDEFDFVRSGMNGAALDDIECDRLYEKMISVMDEANRDWNNTRASNVRGKTAEAPVDAANGDSPPKKGRTHS